MLKKYLINGLGNGVFNMKKVSFTLRIEEEILKDVKIRAIEEGCSISEWISKSIEMALEYGICGSLGNEERFTTN